MRKKAQLDHLDREINETRKEIRDIKRFLKMLINKLKYKELEPLLGY